jgi:uncharacterized protein YfbU (UPF0304 family)
MYTPRKAKFVALQSELDRIKSQIDQLEQNGFMKGEMSSVEVMIQELDRKFPKKEEETIRRLSDLAKTRGVVIVSLRTQSKTDCYAEFQQAIKIENKSCQKVRVLIDIKSTYKDMVEYVQSLKKELPAYITIEKLNMQKINPAEPALNVSLELNLYLLS